MLSALSREKAASLKRDIRIRRFDLWAQRCTDRRPHGIYTVLYTRYLLCREREGDDLEKRSRESRTFFFSFVREKSRAWKRIRHRRLRRATCTAATVTTPIKLREYHDLLVVGYVVFITHAVISFFLRVYIDGYIIVRGPFSFDSSPVRDCAYIHVSTCIENTQGYAKNR